MFKRAGKKPRLLKKLGFNVREVDTTSYRLIDRGNNVVKVKV